MRDKRASGRVRTSLPVSRRSSHVGNAFAGLRDFCFHILSASFLALALRRIHSCRRLGAGASFATPEWSVGAHDGRVLCHDHIAARGAKQPTMWMPTVLSRASACGHRGPHEQPHRAFLREHEGGSRPAPHRGPAPRHIRVSRQRVGGDLTSNRSRRRFAAPAPIQARVCSTCCRCARTRRSKRKCSSIPTSLPGLEEQGHDWLSGRLLLPPSGVSYLGRRAEVASFEVTHTRSLPLRTRVSRARWKVS
jgi:hypothetical protein